jgi:hypothetical protein
MTFPQSVRKAIEAAETSRRHAFDPSSLGKGRQPKQGADQYKE